MRVANNLRTQNHNNRSEPFPENDQFIPQATAKVLSDMNKSISAYRGTSANTVPTEANDIPYGANLRKVSDPYTGETLPGYLSYANHTQPYSGPSRNDILEQPAQPYNETNAIDETHISSDNRDQGLLSFGYQQSSFLHSFSSAIMQGVQSFFGFFGLSNSHSATSYTQQNNFVNQQMNQCHHHGEEADFVEDSLPPLQPRSQNIDDPNFEGSKVWGDPHFENDKEGDSFDVQGKPGETYNIWGDSEGELELNARFDPWNTPGKTAVGAVDLDVGGNQINVDSKSSSPPTINGTPIKPGTSVTFWNGEAQLSADGKRLTVRTTSGYMVDFDVTAGSNIDFNFASAPQDRKYGGIFGQVYGDGKASVSDPKTDPNGEKVIGKLDQYRVT